MLDLNMTQSEFLAHFAACFQRTEAEKIQWDTPFRELEEWGSMLALIVISMIDTEYNCLLTTDDFRQAQTPGDLFLLVQQHLS